MLWNMLVCWNGPQHGLLHYLKEQQQANRTFQGLYHWNAFDIRLLIPYFLVMLVPCIITLIIALQEWKIRNGSLASLLAATLGVAVVLDTIQVVGFLAHRQYQFYSAAKSIREIVDANPSAHRLLLGSSGDQLALMVAIPSINDGYSYQDLDKKVLAYRPGWYVGWNGLDQDILNSLSAYRLDEVANFPVFDREDRDRLKLYRMVPLKETQQ